MIDWQPIETAPKDGTAVLLWCVVDRRPDIAPFATTGQWHMHQFHLETNIKARLTHWAPINAPTSSPQEAQNV